MGRLVGSIIVVECVVGGYCYSGVLGVYNIVTSVLYVWCVYPILGYAVELGLIVWCVWYAVL